LIKAPDGGEDGQEEKGQKKQHYRDAVQGSQIRSDISTGLTFLFIVILVLSLRSNRTLFCPMEREAISDIYNYSEKSMRINGRDFFDYTLL
jgi:hypothetical protein